MVSGERGMHPVEMTIIKSLKSIDRRYGIALNCYPSALKSHWFQLLKWLWMTEIN